MGGRGAFELDPRQCLARMVHQDFILEASESCRAVSPGSDQH